MSNYSLTTLDFTILKSLTAYPLSKVVVIGSVILYPVASGRAFFSTKISTNLIKYLLIGNKLKRTGLSLREVEILKLFSHGNSNKEAANNLGISIRTIECHKRNIFIKLGIKKTSELVKFAIKNDLILN